MTTATAVRPILKAFPLAPVNPPAVGLRAPATGVAAAKVRDLIAATGPLTLRDIAGGLAISERCAAGRVRQMLGSGCLRQDEFGRYRLWGGCV